MSTASGPRSNTAEKPHVNQTTVSKATDSYSISTIKNEEIRGFLKRNQSKIILGSIGVGIAKSIVDGEDDDLVTSVEKGLKTGLVTSVASYGAQHAINLLDNKGIEVTEMFKEKTIKDLVVKEVGEDSKSIRAAAEAERKALSRFAKIGTIGKISAGIIGAATVVDVARKMHDERAAEHMKAEQEWNLKEKDKQRKKQQKEMSYGYLQQGEILFDLFGNRTGHHKMGNAKFQ